MSLLKNLPHILRTILTLQGFRFPDFFKNILLKTFNKELNIKESFDLFIKLN